LLSNFLKPGQLKDFFSMVKVDSNVTMPPPSTTGAEPPPSGTQTSKAGEQPPQTGKTGEQTPPEGGTIDGKVDQGEFAGLLESESQMPNLSAEDKQNASNLLNEIRTIGNLGEIGQGQASQSLNESAQSYQQATTQTHDNFQMAQQEMEARGEVRSDIHQALQSGDTQAVRNLFNSMFGGGQPAATKTTDEGTTAQQSRDAARTDTTRAQTKSLGEGAAMPQQTGLATSKTATGQTSEAASKFEALPTNQQKQVQQFQSARREVAQLKAKLEQAKTEGEKESLKKLLAEKEAAAKELKEAMPPEVAALAEGEDIEETKETGEAEEGKEAEGEEGEGKGVSTKKEGEGAPRKVASFRPTEHLAEGCTVFSSGEKPRNEGEEHLNRMGAGLRICLSGKATEYATNVATRDAVRGSYAEGEGEGDMMGGGGSKGENPLDGVGMGSLTDKEGVLKSKGYSLVSDASGDTMLLRHDGRVYNLYQAENIGDAQVATLARNYRGQMTSLRTAARLGDTGLLSGGASDFHSFGARC
jgi:hypothetical protein